MQHLVTLTRYGIVPCKEEASCAKPRPKYLHIQKKAYDAWAYERETGH